MSVADIPPEKLRELASYLDDFRPSSNSYDDDPHQYWNLLAVTLRDIRNLGQEFKFNEHQLSDIDARQDSAQWFLTLLAQRRLSLDVFIWCLKKINCQKALNVFTRTSPPIIKHQSTGELNVSTGGNITLTVEAECQPGPPTYQWVRGQGGGDVNEIPLPEQNKSTLLLTNANIGDTGFYHCLVSNPHINDHTKGTIRTQRVHVTVSPSEVLNTNPTIRQATDSEAGTPSLPPHITLHPKPVTAALGSEVTLECRAEGAVCYDWFKNGKPFRTEQLKGVLHIEQLSAADAGEYVCQVANDHGKTRSKAVNITAGGNIAHSQEAQLRNSEVIVIEEQPPETLDVRVGEDVLLKCEARSKIGEKITYEWFQTILNRGPAGNKAVRVGTGSSVYTAKTTEIQKLMKLSYFCQVSLTSDPHVVAQSRSCKVTVYNIWITKQPSSIAKALIGNKATLTCNAGGVGNIDYIWLWSSTKDGNFVPREKKPNKSGVLYFNRLRQKDWGYYQCQCEARGYVLTSDTVYVRPTIPTTANRASLAKPPLIRIMKQPWSQVIKEGEQFKLICEAVWTEDIPLEYQWYYCGQKIHGATGHTYIRDHTSESDCGPYYCEVRSSSSPTATPEVSRTARIELAFEGSKDKDAKPHVIKSRSIAQLKQKEGEVYQWTKSKERYAREKVALLIGNQNYQCADLNDLRSPENDIRLLGSLLEDELNFKVISLLDLAHDEMMQALERFYEMLAVSGVYALFYYSGHGFSTSSGKNYLIPVNATVPLNCEGNINVDTICKQMRMKNSRAIVVLDCCRVQASIETTSSTTDLDSFPAEPEPVDDAVSVANYFQITSTQDGKPAYDGHEAELSPAPTPSVHSKQLSRLPEVPCSNFNVAFREALADKKVLHEVFQHVLNKTIELEQRGAIREGQRPEHKGSLRDSEITLHDDVFMDNDDIEPKLEKILKLYEEVHYVPDTVEYRDLQDLSELAQLELSFTYEFTNVLCVHTRLYLLYGDKTSKADITFDLPFLQRQGVMGVQNDCSFESPLDYSDVGGQGENPQIISTMTKIYSIQKLRRDVLEVVLSLSLFTEGKERKANVSYKFPKKPLFANLQ